MNERTDEQILADRMCGYSTGCVAEAIIDYFQRPDCSLGAIEMVKNFIDSEYAYDIEKMRKDIEEGRKLNKPPRRMKSKRILNLKIDNTQISDII